MANDKQKLTVVLEGDSKRLEKALKAADRALKNTDSEAKKTSSKSGGIGMLNTAFRRLAAYGAAGIAIAGVKRFATDAVKMASSLEGVERAFKNVTFASDVSLESLRKATGGAVSDIKLMQQTVQASNFKLPLEGLGKLFEFARVRAQQTGESVEYLTNSIVLGIGRKSPLILDNLGITMVRLKEAMGQTAKSTMTVAQLMEAVSKVAEEETEVLKGLGLTTATTKEQMDSLTASYTNFKASLGEEVVSSSWWDNLMKGIDAFMDRLNLKTSIRNIQRDLGLEDLDKLAFAKEIGATEAIGKKAVSAGTGGMGVMVEAVTSDIKLMERALQVFQEKTNEAISYVNEKFGDLDTSSLRAMAKSGDFANLIEGAVPNEALRGLYLDAFNKLIEQKDKAKSAVDEVTYSIENFKNSLSASDEIEANWEKILGLTTLSEMVRGEASMESLIADMSKLADNLGLTVEQYDVLIGSLRELENRYIALKKARADAAKPQELIEQTYKEVEEYGFNMPAEKADTFLPPNEDLERFRGLMLGISQAFMQGIQSGQSFGDIMKGVFNQLLAQLTSLVATAALLSILFPAAGGGGGAFKSFLKLGATNGGGGGIGGGLLNAIFGDKKGLGQTAGGAVGNIAAPTGIGSGINVNVQGVMRGSDIYFSGQKGNNFVSKRLG